MEPGSSDETSGKRLAWIVWWIALILPLHIYVLLGLVLRSEPDDDRFQSTGLVVLAVGAVAVAAVNGLVVTTVRLAREATYSATPMGIGVAVVSLLLGPFLPLAWLAVVIWGGLSLRRA